MKLRFTRQATQDLNSIADYVSERNPKAALRVRAAIVESLQTLVLFRTSVGDRRLKVSASS
ncbi:MAG TPA: type II toxin-antitoxin system RelE/ParE family toxin [Reyranella sp.]|jgi:plasmid stabilization system protein ParE|nr:type II toxin-antitoxin system RelE/ParE family toxin [Reyranella sp.]